jgi:hypothetical protein
MLAKHRNIPSTMLPTVGRYAPVPHPARPQPPDFIADALLAVARRDFDAGGALSYLSRICEGDLFLFGGCVRNVVLGHEHIGDLDVMVPNGDRRAFDGLDRLKVPYGYSSQGHRRYRWNRLQIDIFEPKDFFCGFDDVSGAVAYFDLYINALAVHVDTREVIDPLHTLGRPNMHNVGINWKRWATCDQENLAILLIRLARILHDFRELHVSHVDAKRIRAEVIPVVSDLDWSVVSNRFPLGRTVFLDTLECLMDRSPGAYLDDLSRAGMEDRVKEPICGGGR